MSRFPKLAGSVLVGIIVTVFVCFFFVLTGIDKDPKGYYRSEYTPFFRWVVLIIPLSLMAGSILTGILGQPYATRKTLSYLFLSPGLYLALCLIIYIIGYTLLKSPIGNFEYYSLFIAVSIIWALISIGGTYLGFRIRSKKRDAPPSLDLRPDKKNTWSPPK